MKRQSARNDLLTNNTGSPNEKRFEKINIPEIWSNIRRVPSAKLKTQGRDDGKGYKKQDHQPDYNPNFEYGKRSLGNSGPCKVIIFKF